MRLSLLDGPDLALHTDLSVEECRSRLEENVDMKLFSWDALREPFVFFGAKLQKQVYGSVRGDRFELQKKASGINRRSLWSVRGVFEPDPMGRGTRITAHAGVCFVERVFLGILVGFLAVMAVIVAVTVLDGGHGLRSLIPALVPIALILVVFTGRVALSKWVSKLDLEFLMEFLKQTLKAEETSQPQLSDVAWWG